MLPYSVILKKNDKRYILFLIVLFVFLFNPFVIQTVRGQTVTLDELKAFPTAEGYGKHVTGGKDGVVLKVTNLNDRGSGSLRAALEDSRRATIVFEVAGTILLNSYIRPTSNKTIAGETAFRNGGQGITLRMNPNQLYNNPLIAAGGTAYAFGNHIWRYIRFRRGQGVAGESSGDNFSPFGNAGRFIIDHCSFMFSTDQNVSFPSVDGYTVQNSITAFGLAYATHAYGTKHSKGSLTSDTPYASWYRNLFSCNDDRNPLIQARVTGITRLELVNNFFYNRGIFGVQLSVFRGGTYHADIIGNYWKDGPNSNRARYGIIWPGETTEQAGNPAYYRNTQWANQRVHVAGNLSPRRTSHSQDDWDVLGRWDDSRNAPLTSKNQHQRLTRLNDGVANDAIIAAEDLQSDLLTDVGVSLYYDSFDSQAISFAINGTGSIVNGNGYSGQNFPEVSTLGPHPNIRNMSYVPADTNNDGIDDDWANTHNISNSSQIKAVYDFGNYQVINNANYTALEIYLAYLAKDFDRMDKENGNATIPVTGLDIDLDALELNIQEVGHLTATITPSNATNQNITWSSSNAAIATVDQSGNVTAVTPGNATITATAVANGNIYDSTQVLVIGGDPTELWLEAECAIVGTNWSEVNNAAASKNSYLLPPVGNNLATAPLDSGSIITFDFTATVGAYKIFARTLTPNGQEDSFWVRVNGGAWLMWNKIPHSNSFGWNQVHDGNDVNSPLTFNLAEGTNTLEIAHREEGAGLDKVFITNTATVPNGFGQVDGTCPLEILVDGITVNPQELDLEINQTQPLTATVSPANATDQSVTWTSSDTNIATVDQNGNVTAIAEGNAAITATANDGSGISDTVQVTVSAAPDTLVDSITINPQQIDLEINQVQPLTADVTPANATDQSITWTVSDTNIATVDQNGNVTALTEGNATITASANDGSGISDTIQLTVSAAPDILVDAITLNPQVLDLEINQVRPLVASVSPANATDQSIIWASSDTNIATVDQNGNVTAIAEGNAAITATANDGSGTFDTVQVSVSPAPAQDILVVDITVNPQEIDLQITQTQLLTATVSPANATDQSVTWTSSATNIATVDQSGNVTALAEGNASITVAANDGSGTLDTVQVTVSPAPDILVDDISVNPQEIDLQITQVQLLTATVSPANATNQSISWASSDTNIATVDQSGNVTAVAQGNASITATANDGSGTSDTVQVTVSAAPDILVENIVLNPNNLDLEISQVQTLFVNVSPANATNQSITWSSSDTTIATVDQNGNVTAVAEGSAAVTANANDAGGASDTIEVNVSAAPDILVDGIIINPQEIELDITQVQTLAANVLPANATDQSITWASSDTTIATVDQNGNVTAVAEGNTTITATANDGSGISNTAQVNVSEALAETILVEEITIDPEELNLEVGQVEILTANVSPTNATDGSITWTSSNTTVATVDQNGNVTAVGEGSATITVTANDFSGFFDTAQIRVVNGGLTPGTTELWLEAECANVGSNWNVMDDAAASGGKYLLPPTGNNYDDVPTDTNSIIAYDFSLNEGTYSIYARAMTPGGSDDSFWVRLNGGDWLLWNQIPRDNSFEWNRIHDGNNVNLPLTFTLLEGSNTLEIAHREDGAGLDKIFITNSTNIPSGLGQTDATCFFETAGDSITDTDEAEEPADEELISPVSLSQNNQIVVSDKTTVYPNPTRGNTMVRFPKDSNYAFFSLYSMNGVLVKEGKIENYQNELPLSLEELENGMYLLRLYTEMGEEVFKKIIKE